MLASVVTYTIFTIVHIVYISGVAGFYNERVRHEMTWNRVANINGNFGKNIPHDLLNDYINGDFKGTKIHEWYICW
jgi:hypothetical protein